CRYGAVSLSESPRHPREHLDRSGTVYHVFLEWEHIHRLLRQSQRSSLVAKTHVNQSEISDEEIVIRLFFDESFQLAARLLPSFVGGGMIAADFLCPAQPET